MKVLHINTFDVGGAGIAAIRLHEAMLKNGVDSTLLTLTKVRKDINQHFSYFELVPKKGRTKYLNPLFYLTAFKNRKKVKYYNEIREGVKGKLECISFLHSPYRIHKIHNFDQYDVIHLHWIADFLDWPTFFKAAKNKKIVWTLHDMAPFTGGYHYSDGYKGYAFSDQDAPFLEKTKFKDIFYNQLRGKIKLFEKYKIDVKIVALSNWLKGCSESSSLFRKFEHFVLSNTLDDNVFRVLDKFECRQELNLSDDGFICLFISDNLINKRKGFNILLSAIESDKLNSNVKFIAVGKQTTDFSNKNVHLLGTISDQSKLALVYGAADTVIIPSIEDNLPNTALEAIFCGKPVIGFNIGGMKDLIYDSSMGELINIEEKDSLFKFINNASSKVYSSASIREKAVFKFNNIKVVNDYLRIYKA